MQKYQLFLLSDIQNGSEVYNQIINAPKEQLDYLLINPSVIYETFLIHLAINKAFEDTVKRTKSIKTEIINNLSHSNSIKESLKVYGFNPLMKEAILVTFVGVPTFLDCKVDPLESSDWEKLRNIPLIKKVSLHFAFQQLIFYFLFNDF